MNIGPIFILARPLANILVRPVHAYILAVLEREARPFKITLFLVLHPLLTTILKTPYNSRGYIIFIYTPPCYKIYFSHKHCRKCRTRFSSFVRYLPYPKIVNLRCVTQIYTYILKKLSHDSHFTNNQFGFTQLW